MFFKPKIFISSVLSLGDEMRKKLERLLSSLGAEPLLYETNLTPSVTRSTYRQDILDADFVIFISDDSYGSLTERGISGTHEEYRIAKDSSIPMHVYLKKAQVVEGAPEDDLKKEIESDRISYYYYEDLSDVLKQVRKMPFVIAKEIAYSNLAKTEMAPKIVMSKVASHDYDTAMIIIRDVEDLNNQSKVGSISLSDTTAFSGYFGPWQDTVDSSGWVFIDRKLDEIFSNLLGAVHVFDRALKEDSHIVGARSSVVKVPSGMSFMVFPTTRKDSSRSFDPVSDSFKSFQEKYEEFKNEVIEQKTRADVHR